MIAFTAWSGRQATAQIGAPPAGRSLGNINFGGGDNSYHSGPAEHLVQGTVMDKAGKPVSGAMVYLKNTRTAEVKLLFADNKGTYRFSPLANDTDYEVWAQVGDKKGPVRPISSFSTGPLTLELHVE